MKKNILILFILINSISYAQFSCVKTVTKDKCKLNLFNSTNFKIGELNLSNLNWYYQSNGQIALTDGTATFNLLSTCLTSPTFVNIVDSLNSWQTQCAIAPIPTNLDTTQVDTSLVIPTLTQSIIDTLSNINEKLNYLYLLDTSHIDTSLINYVSQLDSLIKLNQKDSSILNILNSVLTVCTDTALNVKVICDTCRDIEHTPICIQLTAPVKPSKGKEGVKGKESSVPSKSISGNVGDILQATLVSYYDCKSGAKIGVDSIFYAGANVTIGYNFTVISCPLPQEELPEYVQFGDPICWFRDSSGTVTFYTEIRSKNTKDNNDIISTFLLEPSGSIVTDTTGLNLTSCPLGTYITTIDCYDVLIKTDDLNAGSEVRITCITNTITSTSKCDTTVNGIITDLSAYTIQIGDTFGTCGSYVAPKDTLVVKSIDSTYYSQLDSIIKLLINNRDSFDVEFTQHCYRAISNGVGFSYGDELQMGFANYANNPVAPFYLNIVNVNTNTKIFEYYNGGITVGVAPSLTTQIVPCTKWDELKKDTVYTIDSTYYTLLDSIVKLLQRDTTADTLKALVFKPLTKNIAGTTDTLYNCKGLTFRANSGATGTLIVYYEDGESDSYDVATEDLPYWDNSTFISFVGYDATGVVGKLRINSVGCSQVADNICAKEKPIFNCTTNAPIIQCSGWASASGIWNTISGCWNTGQ